MANLPISLRTRCSCPAGHFAYRDNLCELILHKQANDLSPPAFYGLTSAGLVVFYFTACTLPNIWLPLAVIGSTAGVTVAFIFPALLMMSMDSQNIIRQVAGAGLFAAGACVSISGLVSTFLPLIKGQHAQ